MAELDLENLNLRFGGLTVLEGLSFAVEAGELFALIGPNGAGKTSAFNCISRIYKGEGRIRFRGRDISSLSPRAVAPCFTLDRSSSSRSRCVCDVAVTLAFIPSSCVPCG